MSQKMWTTYPRMPEDDLKLILEYIGSVAVLGMAPYNFLLYGVRDPTLGCSELKRGHLKLVI